MLGPPVILTRLRLLLVNLLLDEHHDKAPRLWVGDFLKGSNQTQYLQIFGAFGHGKYLIGKTSRLNG